MSHTRFSRLITRYSALSLAAAAFLLASCSDRDFDSPASGRKISFEVSDKQFGSRSGSVANPTLATVALSQGSRNLYLIPEVTAGIQLQKAGSRGEVVTKDNIADFGVYAATATTAGAYYMQNVEVTRSNSWTPEKEYLWPGSGSLHINAYSPFRSVADSQTGITALPAADPAEAPTLDFTVNTDVTEQIDLMWATPREGSSSPCALTFNHALAAVRFVAGDELTPCTVKSITLSGLSASGTLNLESGKWTALSGNESYQASVSAELTAASGSEYVEPGAEITDAANTFLLMPQTLGQDVEVSVVVDFSGEEIQYTASLSGQVWEAGNTYTYHLSANPTADRFVITVTSPIAFNYTGGTGSYTVKSTHESMTNGVLTTTEVPWSAEFVDAEGNVIPTPSWITDFTFSASGSGDFSAATKMVEPEFVQISEPSRILRERSEIGSASTPYNLSNSTGAPTVENTANTYVINAPGTYSLPLVYGNAIKNGADNTAAYAPTRSSAPFYNHLNNRIKHPYIYDNEGCNNVKDGVLVWEGRLDMIQNVRLSADKRFLEFDIPKAYIRQGVGLVAVRDANDNIMWSWQIWVTDYVPGDDMVSMTYNGTSFEMMPCNLGYIVGGDETDFASSTALVRFTQHPADGSEGSTATVTIEQTGKHVITPTCYSFYQWGRKDPMISGFKEWYYADHTEITTIETQSAPITNNRIDADFESLCVKHPQVFWTEGASSPTFRYTNNWNTGTSTKSEKTILDPSPVGFMVPGNELMALRDLDTTNYTYTEAAGLGTPPGFHVALPSGPTLFFPALGYRSGNSGHETFTGTSGGSLTALWTNHTSTKEASAQIMNYNSGNITHPLRSDPRLEAFAIRPIRE